jgi:3-oxoacyl-[acyl-carrier protein] reductase
MELGLKGRVALVTGGAAGIGAAIAKTLAREGAIVWIADRDGAAAEEGATSLRSEGLEARATAMDVTDADLVARAVGEAAAEHGRLDVLVCNAGILKTGAFRDAPASDWDSAIAVNLSGVVHCVQAALPGMVARGYGRIVNIASVSAMRGGGSIGNVVYGTTKAGVVALTMGLARELGPSGITVNAVAPAVADTPMTRSSLDPDTIERIVARIPLRRLAKPGDIADLVAFLASDRAAFINGAVVPVDGGLLTT